MTDRDTKRGEKRGVLDTRRAQKLGKTKDADDAADEEDDESEG